MSRRALVGAIAFSALLVSACSYFRKKEVGGACTVSDAGREMLCLDKETALFCKGGRFERMPCHGSDGCKKTDREVFCDNRSAVVGDACDEEKQLACSIDGKAELRCFGNLFKVASTCRGPKGCHFEGNTLHCDTDQADSGDPCEDEGEIACATDAKSSLRCRAGTFAVEASCRGPKGCVVLDQTLHCDDNVADSGDPCKKEGDYACSPDKKALLVCHGNKFKLEQPCRGTGCSYSDNGSVTHFDCH